MPDINVIGAAREAGPRARPARTGGRLEACVGACAEACVRRGAACLRCGRGRAFRWVVGVATRSCKPLAPLRRPARGAFPSRSACAAIGCASTRPMVHRAHVRDGHSLCGWFATRSRSVASRRRPEVGSPASRRLASRLTAERWRRRGVPLPSGQGRIIIDIRRHRARVTPGSVGHRLASGVAAASIPVWLRCRICCDGAAAFRPPAGSNGPRADRRRGA